MDREQEGPELSGPSCSLCLDSSNRIPELLLGQEAAGNGLGKTKWDGVSNRDRLVGRNHYGGQQGVVRQSKGLSGLIGDNQRIRGRDGYRVVPGLSGISVWRIAARNHGPGQVGPILAQEVRRDVRGYRAAVKDVDVRTVWIAIVA